MNIFLCVSFLIFCKFERNSNKRFQGKRLRKYWYYFLTKKIPSNLISKNLEIVFFPKIGTNFWVIPGRMGVCFGWEKIIINLLLKYFRKANKKNDHKSDHLWKKIKRTRKQIKMFQWMKKAKKSFCFVKNVEKAFL